MSAILESEQNLATSLILNQSKLEDQKTPFVPLQQSTLSQKQEISQFETPTMQDSMKRTTYRSMTKKQTRNDTFKTTDDTYMFNPKPQKYKIEEAVFQQINLEKPEFQNSDIKDEMFINVEVDLLGKQAQNLRCVFSIQVQNEQKQLLGRSEIIRAASKVRFTRKFCIPFDFTRAQNVLFDILDLDNNLIENEATTLGSVSIPVKDIVFRKQFPMVVDFNLSNNQTQGILQIHQIPRHSDHYIQIHFAAQHMKDLINSKEQEQIYLRILSKEQKLGVKSIVQTIEPENFKGQVLKIDFPEEKLKTFLPNINEKLIKNIKFTEEEGLSFNDQKKLNEKKSQSIEINKDLQEIQ